MFKVAWKSNYVQPLPPHHRFPMEKYELLPEQLVYEGTLSNKNFFEPAELEEKEIVQTHDINYWNRLKGLKLNRKEQRKSGFPHNQALIKREITIMQGTVDCAKFALQHGVSMNVAGGTHHAYTNRAEGFCLLNDIALGANHLLKNKLVEKILVVDLDVHQGNGTAQIFCENENVFTFSMHGSGNYPLHKEKSDMDIGLADRTGDQEYLKTLKETLPKLIDEHEPDFIFYQSGVDVLENDKLGRLSLSLNGCKERDRFVLESCKKNNIPVCASMGGGYSPNIKEIIEAHANTYRLAMDIFF